MADEKKMVLGDLSANLYVTTFPDKKKEYKAFPWDEIKEIRVKDDEAGFLFFKKPTEKIEILITNPETPSYLNPVEYFKHKEPEYFDEYIEDLKKYAEDKMITFKDQRKKSN